MTTQGGPYIAVAVFCEKVLREQDGVLSAIRIVDRIIQTAIGGGPQDEVLPVTVNLTAFVALKSGSARGTHEVTVRPEKPSGMRLPVVRISALLEGEERGTNIVMPMQFVADEEGLYWFDIVIDEQLLTRIPLRVVIRRVQQGV